MNEILSEEGGIRQMFAAAGHLIHSSNNHKLLERAATLPALACAGFGGIAGGGCIFLWFST